MVNRSNPRYTTAQNKELYNYIKKNYTDSDNPVSHQEIANKFGRTKKGIGVFITSHGLSRKQVTINDDEVKEIIVTLLQLKYSRSDIARLLDVSPAKITVTAKEIGGLENAYKNRSGRRVKKTNI